MNAIYYVYALIDPRSCLPFYIGKGKANRCYDHLKETVANTDNKRKYRYIQALRRKGYNIIVVKLVSDLEEDYAYAIEEVLIKTLGRKGYDTFGILTNICIGNNPPNVKGIKRSDEWKLRSSITQKGKTLTETHLKNLRVAATNRKGVPGKKHTPESIEKISVAKKGKRFTESHKQNLSAVKKGNNTGTENHMFGKSHTTEAKQKMSTSLKGKVRSEEFKDNLRQLKIGIPKEKVTCPHCNLTGGKPTMRRYHFDRCKLRAV